MTYSEERITESNERLYEERYIELIRDFVSVAGKNKAKAVFNRIMDWLFHEQISIMEMENMMRENGLPYELIGDGKKWIRKRTVARNRQLFGMAMKKI